MKVALAPGLEKFVSKKVKTGAYRDASDVIRESLRRWKEQEELRGFAPDWLEQKIQEGIDSPDLPGGAAFWRELRSELHKEHKNGSRRKSAAPSICRRGHDGQLK
jgi:putative addiction module CopG family antidote